MIANGILFRNKKTPSHGRVKINLVLDLKLREQAKLIFGEISG